MSTFKLDKINDPFFSSKPYKTLSKIIVTMFVLLGLVYIFRNNLYDMNNEYISLFAETAPNLLGSSIFTLIGIFYLLPYLQGINSISKPTAIWLINGLNIIIFLLIEYGHVLLTSASWDNKDIIASIIGIIFSTAIYYMFKKNLYDYVLLK